MRLILKHLRRRRYTAYQALLDETGLSIEHPLVSALYEALVVKGDLVQAESIFNSFASSGLLDVPKSRSGSSSSINTHAKPSTVWRQIFDTNADGDTPSARGGHASVLDPERGILYLFGGWDGTDDLADFWAYSIPHQRWTTLSLDTSVEEDGGPTPRSCGAAALDTRSGDIYFLGRYVPRPPTSSSQPQPPPTEGGDSARTSGATATMSRARRIRLSTGGPANRPRSPEGVRVGSAITTK